MKIIMLQTYNTLLKKGTVVTVDKVKWSSTCSFRLYLRVVHPCKRPLWFDAFWFKGLSENSHAKAMGWEKRL